MASNTSSSPLSGKARSAATTASASSSSSAARSYHAHLAQQQLAFQMQQRELVFQATRGAAAMGGPISPRLLPLGSPGPVTPLALEDNPAGYLMMSPSQALHLEKLAAAEQSEDSK
ncbi:hypothetical protein DRE_04098 [Drechslerella stenobrocha 248]|uniref:Uncharacterized protein n=1 Tax=Drechslerella stenobrocha 248 TaxID=1043628 RepID=W7HRE8_9PEZI|nr:hypothetical protein DRE_04098 [Drechslerella stenobrocha 248]